MIEQYDLKNVLYLRYSFCTILSHTYFSKHFHVRKNKNGQLAKSSNENEMIIVKKDNKKEREFVTSSLYENS